MPKPIRIFGRFEVPSFEYNNYNKVSKDDFVIIMSGMTNLLQFKNLNYIFLCIQFANRRNLSGTSTPSGMRTPRKPSVEPPSVTSERKDSRATTPSSNREPFRL